MDVWLPTGDEAPPLLDFKKLGKHYLASNTTLAISESPSQVS
jgi:hypothetical protein